MFRAIRLQVNKKRVFFSGENGGKIVRRALVFFGFDTFLRRLRRIACPVGLIFFLFDIFLQGRRNPRGGAQRKSNEEKKGRGISWNKYQGEARLLFLVRWKY